MQISQTGIVQLKQDMLRYKINERSVKTLANIKYKQNMLANILPVTHTTTTKIDACLKYSTIANKNATRMTTFGIHNYEIQNAMLHQNLNQSKY